ncbi:MAG: DsbA family protein [bacterium]|nr:DsbA family protein [bacterium]
MRKRISLLLLIILSLALCQAAIGQEASDGDARKAKIIANLKMKYSQLRTAQISVGDIVASDYQGLERGSFTVNGKEQKFLLSADDKALYFISEPLDVSRSTEEIEAEMAEEKAKQGEMLANLAVGQPIRGNPDAPVTIIEFSDFQCPYCARGAQTVDQILEKYPEDVKVVFQHFPLGFHKWAKPAAIAAHCAGLQNGDAFWSLHDSYFKDQKALNEGNVMAKSKEYLGESELDMEQWATCAENKETEQHKAAAKAVDDAMATGGKLGVTGTPGFFVNGTFLNGAQPLSAFEPLIAKAKEESGS